MSAVRRGSAVCTENLILIDYVIESPTRRRQARSNPATGKFKSSHKTLNPASTGLGVLASFNPLWPLLNL